MKYECAYKSVYTYLKFSDHEEQMEVDHEPSAEMPVLDLKLTKEEEKQTLDPDEGFGEFDPGSSEQAELLKEKKVGLNAAFISNLIKEDLVPVVLFFSLLCLCVSSIISICC